MNFRKSILSLATILALGNTVIADDTATYMPLASDTVDSSWILFGVNGFSDGTPSDLSAASSVFSGGLDSLEDTITTDDLATTGINGWASLQALKDSSVGIGTLFVGIDTSGTPDPTEAMRSMYIKVPNTVTNPNVKLNYRASLENQDFEILLDGTLYNATISQDSTWANPALAASGSTAASTDDRLAITELIDFDFSDNPVDAKHFDSTTHLDDTGTMSSFFYFNAITQQWEVNQKGAPTEAQDFTDFTVGKAYWGRADRTDALGTATPIGAGGSVGIVLGEATQVSNLPDPDRYQDESNVSTLTTGWNMLSFDNSKPYIRHAATGLTIDVVTNSDEAFQITDSSGLNSITLTAFAAGGTEADVIIANAEIESAKLRGLLPTSFNVKLFQGLAAGTIVILSDEKFSITQTAGTAIGDVKTLFNQDPYVDGVETPVGDLLAGVVATSVYGEYTMMVEPIVGATSADTMDAVTGAYSKIKYTEFGQTNADTFAMTTAGNSDLAEFKAEVEATGTHSYTYATVDPIVTQVDVDFDGTIAGDMMIIASSLPFSIEDATYIRSFDVTTAVPAVSDTITIDIGTGTPVTVLNGDTVADIADNIDVGVSGIAGLSSQSDTADATKINVAYNVSNTFDIKDIESGTGSVLSESRTVTTDPVIKGAIEGVYALDTVARLAVNQVTTTTDAFETDAGGIVLLDVTDSWTIEVVDRLGATHTTGPTAIAGTDLDTYGELLTMLDAMVAGINSDLDTADVHGYAFHDFSYTTFGVVSTTALPAAGVDLAVTLTVKGVDIVSTNVTYTDIAGDAPVDPTEASAGDNEVSVGSGDIVVDLKTNPAFTPNYAIYGPLYTLRDSGTGYDARAILKATTEMDTANNPGVINWDSIDLTRTEDAWFTNNEFNLFNINHDSGYWVYLEDKGADEVNVSATATFSGAYTYYFDTTLASGYYATSNVINNGQFSITIEGLTDTVAGSAYAIIGAEEVALERSGSTDTFTATVSDYGLQTFVEGGTTDIKVRAVNGKGEAVSVTAVVTIDYAKPTTLAAALNGSTDIDLSADTNTTSKFYVFEDAIPELEATRDAYILANPTAEITASGDAASFNACSLYDYGVENTLRIVAADGNIDSSNLSDSVEVVYASLLKEATILAHDPSSTDLKAQIGKTYDASCDLNATQTLVSENAGVSVASLDSNDVLIARISFQPIDDSSFDQSTAWTSNYEINNGDGAIVQIQNTPEYAGETFFLEYNSVIYSGTFPATLVAADATIVDPTDLTGSFTADNTSLAD